MGDDWFNNNKLNRQINKEIMANHDQVEVNYLRISSDEKGFM